MPSAYTSLINTVTGTSETCAPRNNVGVRLSASLPHPLNCCTGCVAFGAMYFDVLRSTCMYFVQLCSHVGNMWV